MREENQKQGCCEPNCGPTNCPSESTGTDELTQSLGHADPRRRLEGVRGFARRARDSAPAERPPIVEQLARVVADREPFVRWNLAMALGEIGHAEAMPLLAQLAADADPVVRWHAAVALGDVGNPKGLEALTSLAQDPVPFTRAHTAIALAEIGDAVGLSVLDRLAEDKVPRVAAIAQAARESLRACCAPAGGPGSCH